MIGRVKELQKLNNYTKNISKGKFGGITYLYGDAGFGKTILISNFNEINNSQFNICFMQTDNLFKKDMNPFIYFFKNYFKHSILQLEKEKNTNFENIYSDFLKEVKSLKDYGLVTEMKRIKSLIAGLIGISIKNSIYNSLTPKDKHQAVNISIKEFFKTLSLLKPLIIIIEDIQWLDNESQEMFKLLTRKIENYPIMIIATGRISSEAYPIIKTDEKIQKNKIILKKFTKVETDYLIQEKLGNQVSNNVFNTIKLKTKKSPFLIEQMCLYICENKLLNLKNNKYEFKEDKKISFGDFESIIFSRIENLSEDFQNILLASSIMEKGCEPGVVSEIVALLANITTEGTIKKNAEDIYMKEENKLTEHYSSISEISYILDHTPNLAIKYKMKFKDKLKQIHKLAARTIEKNYREEYNEELAYHYEQSDSQKQALECYIKSGDYSKERYNLDTALSMYEKALELCENSKCEKSIVSSIFNSIGDAFFGKADFNKALEYYKKALLISEEISGIDNSDVSTIYYKIGRVNFQKGGYEEALNYYKKTLKIRKKIFGEKHPDTAMTYNKMGRTYLEIGNYEKAMEYINKALIIQIEILGEKHSDTTVSFNDIGIVYSEKGEYAKALKYYHKALTLQIENKEKKQIQIARFNINIGTLYINKGEYERALEYNTKALSIFKEILGEKHIYTAMSYHNIAAIFEKKKELKKSLKYYTKAISIFKEILEEKHPHIATAYCNIAIVYKVICNYYGSLEYLNKALSIRKEKLGEKHPHTALSYENIGDIYKAMRKNKKAVDNFNKALEIYKYLKDKKSIAKIEAKLKK